MGIAYAEIWIKHVNLSTTHLRHESEQTLYSKQPSQTSFYETYVPQTTHIYHI